MNPKFRIIFSTILFLICQLTYAVQCPSVTDWSHTPGEAWVLSQNAQAAGWEALSYDGANASELTTLPEDKYLLVGLSALAHRFSTCGYSLQRGDHDKVIVAVNENDAADIKKLQPPFHCHHARCFCETVAGKPDACVWQWK